MKKKITMAVAAFIAAQGISPAFAAENTERANGQLKGYSCSGGDCAFDFVRVALMTSLEGYYVWNVFSNDGSTSFRLNSVLTRKLGELRLGILTAEHGVAEAEGKITEYDRAGRVNRLKTELDKLTRAADVGDVSSVSISVESIEDINSVLEIRKLEGANERLWEQIKILNSKSKKAIELTKQQEINLANIQRIRAQTVKSLSASAVVEAKTVDIYKAELQPAIEELSRRLAAAERIPVISEIEKQSQIAIAKASLKAAKANAGNLLLKSGTALVQRIAMNATGVIVFYDASMRVLLYIGGKDPFVSPAYETAKGNLF